MDEQTGEVTDPIRANIPQDLAPDELTPEKARELIEQGKSDAAWENYAKAAAISAGTSASMTV